jgi:hypothetical protein
LDKWSAFPFENFLWSLKRRIRGANNPLQQAVSCVRLGSLSNEEVVNEIIYTASHPNNFCLICFHTAVEIKVVHATGFIDGCIWKLSEDLYTYPCKSSLFSVGWYLKTLETVHKVLPVNKLISLSSDNKNQLLLVPYIQ